MNLRGYHFFNNKKMQLGNFFFSPVIDNRIFIIAEKNYYTL